MFHVHLWISFIHCSIECRFYCPCCRTGYAGFSIQAHFLNLVSAVLSLNSLCQFILCINNLLPQEVISFGMFYCLFCCLDHVIQSFSMMLRSIILRSVPTFGFCRDLVTASTCVSSSRSLWLCWGDSLLGLSSGSLDGQHSSPSCSRPSLIGRESFWGFSPNSSFLLDRKSVV